MLIFIWFLKLLAHASWFSNKNRNLFTASFQLSIIIHHCFTSFIWLLSRMYLRFPGRTSIIDLVPWYYNHCYVSYTINNNNNNFSILLPYLSLVFVSSFLSFFLLLLLLMSTFNNISVALVVLSLIVINYQG